ncbi:hypothetical protein SESBI_33769 [Sesbania bispinosa]|nr:hypothetical protein SESBI_33769 [Sesbania bispinosa]
MGKGPVKVNSVADIGRTQTFIQKPNYGIRGPIESKPQDGQGGEKWVDGGKRLSQTELQEMSKKGLRFKCGEKWGPEHV